MLLMVIHIFRLFDIKPQPSSVIGDQKQDNSTASFLFLPRNSFLFLFVQKKNTIPYTNKNSWDFITLYNSILVCSMPNTSQNKHNYLAHFLFVILVVYQ